MIVAPNERRSACPIASMRLGRFPLKLARSHVERTTAAVEPLMVTYYARCMPAWHRKRGGSNLVQERVYDWYCQGVRSPGSQRRWEAEWRHIVTWARSSIGGVTAKPPS